MLYRLAGSLIPTAACRFASDEADTSTDPRTDGGGSPPPESRVSDTPEPVPSPVEGEDDDDLDTDPLTDETLPSKERWNRVTGALKKAKRQLAKLRPLKHRLDGVNLDEALHKARNYDIVNAAMQRNPKLRELLLGESPEREPARRRPASEPDDEEFDESKLPFDPAENEVNKWIAKLGRESAEGRKLARQLQAEIDRMKTAERTRSEAQVRTQWKTAIDAAAAKIRQEGIRTIFKDQPAAAYLDVTRNHKPFTAQQIIDHYLRLFEKDGLLPKGEQKLASAAAQQRIAENNKTLPRNVAGGGSPAPARNTRETMDDVRRRLQRSA
jgi:hypothetical protein